MVGHSNGSRTITGTKPTGMVTEHEAEHPSQWAAVSSIAAKIGCSAHTLHRELLQANEILRKASAYFAGAELDRPLKR